MRHSVRVRVVERRRDLPQPRDRGREIDRTLAAGHRLERLARHELHHEVGHAAAGGIDAEVGDGDDVRVGEPAERFGLDAEALEVVRGECGARVQQLHRHALLQGEVRGAIDGAERAAADRLVQQVRAVEHHTGSGAHGRHYP